MADRRTKIILGLDAGPYIRGLSKASTATKAFVKDLDTSDSRMSNLVQSATALAPALVPIGAAAVPAVAALTAGLGAAAGAAAVAALAFNGVGEGLGALNDYQLEPSAENLAKVREEFEKLGPAGTEFVVFLDDLQPKLDKLQNTARSGFLPGVEDGITSLMDRAPQVNRIIGEISGALGDLAAEGGKNLAGPKFDEFFDYIENEARPILTDMGRTLGNVFEGISNMIVDFDPLADDFSGGLLEMSRDFAKWTRNLEDNQGFQDFVEYVQRVSPKALDTIGAIAVALADIVEAAAPVGEVTLPVIKALATAIGTIADSQVGPALVGAAAGLSALSRAIAVGSAANGSALAGAFRKSSAEGGKLGKTGEKLSGIFSGKGALAGGIGLVALSMTDLDEKAGLSNAALGAMLGAVAGPWGAAIGGGIGLVKDFTDANDELDTAVSSVDKALSGTDFGAFRTGLKDTRDEIKKSRDGLADFGSSDFWFGNPADAAKSTKNSIVEFFTDDIDEAKEKVDNAADDMRRSLQKLRDFTLTPDGGGFENYTMSLKDLSKFAERAQPALRKMGYSLKDLKNVRSDEELRRIAAGIRHFTREADSVPGRASDVRKAIRRLDDPMISASDSAEKLDAALSNLMDPDLDAEEAGIAYRTGIMEIRKEIAKTNGTLRKWTPAGEANRQMLLDQARALKDLAVAQAEQDGNAKRAFRTLRGGRKDMIDAAVAAGVSRKAAERYIDKLTHIPSVLKTKYETPGSDRAIKDAETLDGWVRTIPGSKKTDFSTPGIESATNKTEGLERLINDAIPDKKDVNTNAPGADKAARELGVVDGKIKALSDKSVGITLSSNATKIVSNVKDVFANLFADGGVVEAYADGGMRENHVAQIARPGAMRVWAEPETGGESYIPLAPSKRKRSIDIWQETGRRLGVDNFADGAVLVDAMAKLKGNPRKDVDRIDKTFEELAAQMGKGLSKYMNKQIESLQTGFHWPLPRRYDYSGSWGSYESGGSHPALDFPAPRGTPIYAVLPGKVQHTTSLGDSYGNYTEVSHGGGLSSLYAHQQRFAVKAGDRVGSGETIGYVNSTGNSTGDHLHLEMQRGGNSFNFTKMLNSGGALNLPGDYDLHGSGVSQYVPVVKDVLRALHGRKSALPSIMSRMQQESGGDADIVNTTDSNAAAGTPSVGLMQVIGPTYDAYKPTPDRGPYIQGTSIDPFSNIYAGLNYARSRYGTIENGMTQPGGYENGGWLMPGELGYNETRTPEAVLSGAESKLFRSLIDALGQINKNGHDSSGGNGNRGRLHGFGGPRRFRAPNLERATDRELNRAEGAIARADARLRQLENAVDRAEKAVKDAKGKAEKADATARLKMLEDQRDAAEKGQQKAEKRLEEARANSKTSKADQKMIDRAFKQFDIKPGMDKSEARAEVTELMRSVKDALGKDSKLYKALENFRDRLVESAKRLGEERKEREKLNADLKALRQKSNQYASGIAGQFKNDPFTGGLDEFFLQTRADRNDAKKFNRLRGRANRMGLDGPLARDLLASGNVELLAELVNSGKGAIKRAEAAYESRNKFAGRAGDRSAQNIYGEQIRKQNRTLNHLDRTIKHLENKLDKLGGHVKDGARDGTREGNKHKDKKVNQFTVEARG